MQTVLFWTYTHAKVVIWVESKFFRKETGIFSFFCPSPYFVHRFHAFPVTRILVFLFTIIHVFQFTISSLLGHTHISCFSLLVNRLSQMSILAWHLLSSQETVEIRIDPAPPEDTSDRVRQVCIRKSQEKRQGQTGDV